MASIAPSTLKQYSSSLKLWQNYCWDTAEPEAIYAPDKQTVVKFLCHQAELGAAFGTLNTHRAALSFISEEEVGKHHIISRILKGCFRTKPPRPKYSKTWDVSRVLDFLKTITNEASLKLITYKTLMLIALATAQRAQTLSLIKVENIAFGEDGVSIVIDELTKTSNPRNPHTYLNLPYFRDCRELCVSSMLQTYLGKTQARRGQNPYLFLSLTGPPKSVGSQTISRWLKNTLGLSGIDTSVFTGHSTRHAATSAAEQAGIDIDSILKTVGWEKTSKVFAQFYRRPIMKENDFAKAIFRQN